jgi:hypothetical protein
LNHKLRSLIRVNFNFFKIKTILFQLDFFKKINELTIGFYPSLLGRELTQVFDRIRPGHSSVFNLKRSRSRVGLLCLSKFINPSSMDQDIWCKRLLGQFGFWDWKWHAIWWTSMLKHVWVVFKCIMGPYVVSQCT